MRWRKREEENEQGEYSRHHHKMIHVHHLLGGVEMKDESEGIWNRWGERRGRR